MKVLNRIAAILETVIESREIRDHNGECFVVDARANLSPSDHVQSKLMQLLPASSVPISSLHTSRDTRRYARS